MRLLLIVLIPLLGAWLPALAGRWGRDASAWTAAGLAATALGLTASAGPGVFDGQAPAAAWPWLPALGLEVALRMDGLALLFALLIPGIGLLVVLYARYYLAEDEPMGRFYAQLSLFMGAMLGVVLADNLLLLLVFWELTSLSSFLLIGFWHHRDDARQGARMALIVTGGGGLALLAGFLLLGEMTGSYSLSEVLASGDAVRTHPLYPAALVLILLGAFTKSAQFPFHFWLPQAMAAPTPVSAYLHSATMVKAGVFLLARLFPVLSGTDLWLFLVAGTGLATLLFGAYTSLFQHDVKGLLAYSTISHLGLITLLFGMGTPLGAVAGVFHVLNHATFKASLFMAAGIIDHETGTRDMRRLNGLWRYMPHTASLATVAAAAMAGVPLLNGFLSKEMFFTEILVLEAHPAVDWLLPGAALLAGVFAVAYSARFVHDVFFNGEPVDLPRVPHEPPAYMKVPVEVLVATCLLVGVFPAGTVAPLLAVAATASVGAPLPEYSLQVWHGLSVPFAMSVAALVGGIAVYAARRHLFRLHDTLFPRVDARAWFERSVRLAAWQARRLTAALENGSLQGYLAWLLAGAVVAVATALGADGGPLAGPLRVAPVDPVTGIGALAIIVAAVVTVVRHRERLVALVHLSVVGLLVALGFARFSGPDLALTQLSVEVVTTVLLLLALYFLPSSTPRESSRLRRVRDLLVAAGVGGGVGSLTWAVLTRPSETLSGFYVDQSVPGGGGTNVVNVILVDFRGFDTLGEITVLGVAALGVYALLERLVLRPPARDAAGRAWDRDPYPLVAAILSRVLLPMALMVSLFLLLRGHNEPGGGFIAGLVTAAAIVLQFLASGVAWTRERLRGDGAALIGWGVSIAALTGLASWAFGRPFLTSAHGYLHLPLVGEVPLASAMVFDLGVYLTVVGATVLILARLGRVAVLGRAAEGEG